MVHGGERLRVDRRETEEIGKESKTAKGAMQEKDKGQEFKVGLETNKTL
jgi:hypothetical protein